MTTPTPFYFQWEFWTAVIALAALFLSQLPPLHTLLRKGKLKLEAYDRLHITHTLGNSNAQLHLILINRGGRPLRVRSISLTLRRGNDAPFTLDAMNYYQSTGDTSTVMLTPFSLGEGQEWAHIVGFIAPFSRQDEQRFRQIQSAMRADIQAKKLLPGNADVFVEADAATLNPAMAFFHQRFKWEPGEYALTVRITAEPQQASVEKNYRIILFESDSADLRRYTDDYKYGLGVYFFSADRQPGILPTLTEN